MNRKERRAASKKGERPAERSEALALGSSKVDIVDLAGQARDLYGLGRFAEAQAVCRQILAREPAHAQSLNLLGLMAQASGDHRRAVKLFASAIASEESNDACHYNIGNSYQALGNRAKAIAHFNLAISFGMDETAASFILQSPAIATYVARIAGKWPLPVTGAELFGSEGVIPLANDLFLLCAMEVTLLPGVQLEKLMQYARAELLRLAGEQAGGRIVIDEGIVAFACALARQCFINEYIYEPTADEGNRARVLRDKLLRDMAAGAVVTPLMLAVVAAYFPLHSMPTAKALLGANWSAPLDGLIRIQLREPLEELDERAAIASLAPIENSVSIEVMRQYEENPYPRWTINPLNALAADRARGKVVSAADRLAELDILIAGCGTGLHAVQTAQVYPNARLLALDVSLTSLAYARRRTRELRLSNIEYMQADILELSALGRTFDRIESVGVLHHLAEPTTGWRILVSLLRPGGKMRIGLYSRLARHIVIEAQAHIEARGYRAVADDIRRCRRDLISDARRWDMLIAGKDFYSMSGCRDLLFNVMEHQFTIDEIASFLKDNDLSFLGFEPFDDPTVIERFHQQFSGNADATSLDQWSRFEADHPDTFLGMYLFTAVKKAH